MPKNRVALEQEEKRLMEVIDQQSVLLEQKVAKTVKTGLIVGASLVAGYTIYSLLFGGGGEKRIKSTKNASLKIINNPLAISLLQSVIKKSIELLVREKPKNIQSEE